MDLLGRYKGIETDNLLCETMMNEKLKTIQELDVVALLHDFPNLGLVTGQVGAVVEMFDDERVEVEFVTPQGETFAQAVLRVQDLLVLHYSPVAA